MNVAHDLYQDTILDHNRRPRNVRAIEGGRKAEGYNRLCGDRLTVYVRVEGEVIADASFVGKGCAICTASASLMTEAVVGKPVADVRALCDRVHQMLVTPPGGTLDDLGALTALAGVRQFPVRIKCATLAWQTLGAAVEARDAVVSTE